jgi:phasin family protein
MNKQTEKYLAPVQALNALMVENVEKIVALQIKRFEENAKLAVDQLKAVTSVKDVDGLKEFLNGYAEVARQFGERSVEDARTIIELGNTSSVKAQSIFKDAVSTN